MAKEKTVFFCSNCGQESIRWVGRCPGCGEYNTMTEQKVAAAAKPGARGARSTAHKMRPVRIDEIPAQDHARRSTGFTELDRVLGGGLVPGSLVLLGGDPCIGKSTILLQVSGALAAGGTRVLYVSGEESARQIKMRAARLSVDAPELYVLAETQMEAVLSEAEEMKPDLLIIDSVQTLYCEALTSAPGSVSQVHEVTGHLMRLAKTMGCAIVLVGHVTKEGAIAGPRVLEHMVDAVLYFEGDRHHQFRILRAVKNRFGSTNEIGLFEMKNQGIVQVDNPSEMFLSSRPEPVPGSGVVCAMEGTRPVLVELQALVTTTSFGMPRRQASGVDYNRLILMAAVLEKKMHLALGNQDIYINVAGGLRLDEPAVDLGIAMMIVSSFRGKALPMDMVCIGEIGLTGEVRGVPQMERRLAECVKLGFHRCVVPKDGLRGVALPDGIELVAIEHVGDAMELMM